MKLCFNFVRTISKFVNFKDFGVQSLTKDASTQTDQIFFKMHWSYFAKDYKIIEPKPDTPPISKSSKLLTYSSTISKIFSSMGILCLSMLKPGFNLG